MGNRCRSSTTMVAPYAFSAFSKYAK